MCCDQIHKLAVELSQNTVGSSDYLSSYHTAHNQVEASLTDNECQKYNMMAKEWLEKKLPPKMQQRYAHVNGSSRLELADFSALV